MATHHYTDKTYYEYDQTLTQTLLTQYINTLSSSTAIKTDQTDLGDMVNMSRFTGSRHEPNPDISSGESEEERPSTVTSNIVNFINATGVNFDQARSAASAASRLFCPSMRSGVWITRWNPIACSTVMLLSPGNAGQ